MSPEERAEKKKAEIEAEFARYKLARKMAKAQAEEDEEGTANGGENECGWIFWNNDLNQHREGDGRRNQIGGQSQGQIQANRGGREGGDPTTRQWIDKTAQQMGQEGRSQRRRGLKTKIE